MLLFFDAILVFLLDVNISQNKLFQCVDNVTNVIMRGKILELINYLFYFTISKFDMIAISQNGNCQASSKAIFAVF